SGRRSPREGKGNRRFPKEEGGSWGKHGFPRAQHGFPPARLPCCGVMVRRFLIALVAAAALAGPAAAAPPSLLMPDVTFHREFQFTVHGAAVVNVIEAPRPTGLYSLRPVLGRGPVQGEERLPAMEKRPAPSAPV